MKKLILAITFLTILYVGNAHAVMPACGSPGTPCALVSQQPDSNDLYVCQAPVATPTSTALWQCQYVQTSGTTTTVTWANGNQNYTNVATNPSSLSYS